MIKNSKILIIEFDSVGHHAEYLKHLLNGIINENLYDKYILCITPELQNVIYSFNNRALDNITDFISDQTIKEYKNSVISKKSELHWKVIKNKIKQEPRINEVLFMQLNIASRNKNVWNLFLLRRIKFSGIYFQSPYRLRLTKDKGFLRRFKREMLLKILLYNKKCKNIYLLNDSEGTLHYSKWSKKIIYLPDPVNIVPPKDIDIRKLHMLKPDSFVFLHIGALRMSKGSFDILEACKKLPSQFSIKNHILFVGKMEAELFQQAHEINTKTNIITCRNEFVDEETFSAYLEQADCLLVTNKNVEASSGILNHALARKKLIIAREGGYYKKLLNNYKGVSFFNSIESLAESMQFVDKEKSKMIQNINFDTDLFIKKNSPQQFFNIINQSLT